MVDEAEIGADRAETAVDEAEIGADRAETREPGAETRELGAEIAAGEAGTKEHEVVTAVDGAETREHGAEIVETVGCKLVNCVVTNVVTAFVECRLNCFCCFGLCEPGRTSELTANTALCVANVAGRGNSDDDRDTVGRLGVDGLTSRRGVWWREDVPERRSLDTDAT